MIVRILVCGGRDFKDYKGLFRVLDNIIMDRGYHENDQMISPNVHIIAGKAKGADTFAVDWAVINQCEFTEYPADWDKHKKAAGAIRNQQMLDEGKPDLVVAFPGGVGTADMVRRAKKAGVEVIEVQ